MKTVYRIVVALALVGIAWSESEPRKEKREVAVSGPSSYDFFGVSPILSAGPWSPAPFASPSWNPSAVPDIPLTRVQVQATHDVAVETLRSPIAGTPSIALPPDVSKAIQRATEANQNVNLAQQRVAEAKQAAVIQRKIALAKEAAARDAAARSQEISSAAEAEARASAKQLVALQQRLASLKDAVAAIQRVAAAREAAAAAAIQRNAAETAAQLRKQDVEEQIGRSEQEAKEKDLIAAKENAVANAVTNAARFATLQGSSYRSYRPWAR